MRRSLPNYQRVDCWSFSWLATLWLLCGDILAQPTLSAPEADAKSEKSTEIDGWVRSLSNGSFLVRERATSKLDELGEESLPHLSQLFEQLTDPEARARLSGILSRIKAEQKQNRKRQFILSPSPDETYDFEGWTSFRRACGLNDRRARFTFLEMLEEYPELVFQELKTKEEASEKATQIATKIAETMTMATRGNLSEADCLAMLYCGVLSEDALDKGTEEIGNQVFMRLPFTSMANATRVRVNAGVLIEDSSTVSQHARMSVVVNNLFSKWALRSQDEVRMLVACFDIQNPTAAILARRYLEDPQAFKRDGVFELSMQALARFGNKDDIPLVEKFLEDKRVVAEFQRFAIPDGRIPNQNFLNFQVQARDIALAVDVMLHEVSPYDYFEIFRTHGNRGFVIESVGLPTIDGDKRRDDRLKRFREVQKDGVKAFRTFSNEQSDIR